jgi:hypothetical protein
MRSLAFVIAAGLVACGPAAPKHAAAPEPVDVVTPEPPAEDPLRAAEARYRKAREVDLQRSLTLVPGVPLCPDKANAQAYFSGGEHRCETAPGPAPVTVVTTAAIGEQDFYEVRAPRPAGEGVGDFWIPTDGVTNDLDELKAAFDALNAAHGGRIAP